jgi:predicted  nucleic acid-binding Zn-ribbon protein
MQVDQSVLLDCIERLANKITSDRKKVSQLEKSIEVVSQDIFKPIIQWEQTGRSPVNVTGASYFLSNDYVRSCALLHLRKQIEDCKNSIRFNTKKIVEYTKKIK